MIDSVQGDQGWKVKPRIKRITIQQSERVILYARSMLGSAVRLAFKEHDDSARNAVQ